MFVFCTFELTFAVHTSLNLCHEVKLNDLVKLSIQKLNYIPEMFKCALLVRSKYNLIKKEQNSFM